MKCPHRFNLEIQGCIGSDCLAFETETKFPSLYEWDVCRALNIQFGEVRKMEKKPK